MVDPALQYIRSALHEEIKKNVFVSVAMPAAKRFMVSNAQCCLSNRIKLAAGSNPKSSGKALNDTKPMKRMSGLLRGLPILQRREDRDKPYPPMPALRQLKLKSLELSDRPHG
jgi:hypothetical protein